MIRILTDTASDITLTQAAELDVEIVSLRILFGDTPYEQLGDETFEEFYRLLEENKDLPMTSQPPPADFLAHFARAKKRRDSVIVIPLSSKISGTMQAALVAKEMAGYEDIHVIDSGQVAIGQRLLVEYAVKLREQGRGVTEIVDVLTGAAGRMRLFTALDTLKYLRKGGRIPKSAEVLGSVLGIKPILQLREGAIEMVGKARGQAGAVTALMKLLAENSRFDPVMPVYFGYTQNEALGKNLRKLASAKFKKIQDTVLYHVGGTIGAHVGPGAVAVAYLVKP